ncbi:MAG: sigma-70 family RNA polymerase sigma factor [Lachnospiraceae bacterium]|nr:sigma-70 family RNA polymerase sigma factor [Lachnospiraceae bacterium]
MITEDIIKQAQAGDSEAFAMIYNETIKTAYYVAKRILLDEDATEDVLQEAYIAVFNHLSDYKTGNLQGWIDTIVANRAKNYLRRKNPILFSEMETEENPVVEFEEEKMEFRPDEKVDYNETQRLILEMVDNLSPEQRLSIMLFYFEDKSVKEIAEICECSENTVKSRLNYARKKIKEDVLELEKKGTKLYSVSIIPFIIWLLAEKAKSSMVSQGVVAKIFTGVSTGVNTATNAAAGAVANTAANTAANTVANTAGNMVGNTIMNTAVNATVGTTTKVVAGKVGMALGAKIALSIAGAAVAAGAVIGGVAIVNHNQENETSNYISATEQQVIETTVIEGDTTTSITEDSTAEEVESNDWKCLEGHYLNDYRNNSDGGLIISNVQGDVNNLEDITFDVEYGGENADEVIIEGDIIKTTFNREDGSRRYMEFRIWTDFEKNEITGKILELVESMTINAEGNVASMNNVAPVIYSQYVAYNKNNSVIWRPVIDGKYEQDASQMSGTPDDFVYSVSVEQNEYGDRIVIIEIHNKDGLLIDTLTSESFYNEGGPFCNFWAKTMDGAVFVCRLECIEKHTKLELNCNLYTKDYTPDWYNGENLNAYVTAIEN